MMSTCSCKRCGRWLLAQIMNLTSRYIEISGIPRPQIGVQIIMEKCFSTYIFFVFFKRMFSMD